MRSRLNRSLGFEALESTGDSAKDSAACEFGDSEIASRIGERCSCLFCLPLRTRRFVISSKAPARAPIRLIQALVVNERVCDNQL